MKSLGVGRAVGNRRVDKGSERTRRDNAYSCKAFSLRGFDHRARVVGVEEVPGPPDELEVIQEAVLGQSRHGFALASVELLKRSLRHLEILDGLSFAGSTRGYLGRVEAHRSEYFHELAVLLGPGGQIFDLAVSDPEDSLSPSCVDQRGPGCPRCRQLRFDSHPKNERCGRLSRASSSSSSSIVTAHSKSKGLVKELR